jgi:hypothetical protein
MREHEDRCDSEGFEAFLCVLLACFRFDWLIFFKL